MSENTRREYWSPEIETMPAEAMRRFQEQQLKKQIQYLTTHSIFYRRKFKEAGLQPADIKTLEDLAKLPFTTKQELRESQAEAPPFGVHLAAPLETVRLVQSTAGTSGKPVFQALTKNDLQSRYDVYSRAFWGWGIRPGDKVVHALALSMFGGGIAVCNSVMNTEVAVIPAGAEMSSDRLLHMMKDLRPQVLIITASYAEYLPGRCRPSLGMDAAGLGIKIIGCFAEPGGEDPVIRSRLEKAWGAVVYDGGGSSDAGPVLFANCRNRQGKHFLAPDFGIVELIDPETLLPVEIEEGAEGEWVVTHLTREACPLLRFRVGDRIKVFTQPCDCGRTGFRMLYMGRIDEMLLVRGMNVFPSAVKSVVSEFVPRTTGEIRIILDHPGPKVEPPVKIKVEHGLGVGAMDLPELRGQIEGALHLKLHFRAQVELVPENSLPRFTGGMGKAKLVEVIKQ